MLPQQQKETNHTTKKVMCVGVMYFTFCLILKQNVWMLVVLLFIFWSETDLIYMLNVLMESCYSFTSDAHQSLIMRDPFKSSTLMPWPHQICMTSQSQTE